MFLLFLVISCSFLFLNKIRKKLNFSVVPVDLTSIVLGDVFRQLTIIDFFLLSDLELLTIRYDRDSLINTSLLEMIRSVQKENENLGNTLESRESK
jgi:hypothetical protein